MAYLTWKLTESLCRLLQAAHVGSCIQEGKDAATKRKQTS